MLVALVGGYCGEPSGQRRIAAEDRQPPGNNERFARDVTAGIEPPSRELHHVATPARAMPLDPIGQRTEQFRSRRTLNRLRTISP